MQDKAWNGSSVLNKIPGCTTNGLYPGTLYET